MKVHGTEPQHERRAPDACAHIAVLGYGPAGREHALALRASGNEVSIGLRLGGMSWVRAREDGFRAEPPSVIVGDADVVVVLVPDDEQPSLYVHAIEPHLTPGALVVFGRGLAIETGAFDPRGFDVVLVTGEEGSARVAVHHDATGRALERAIAYARARFGKNARVGTTTVAAEVDAELAAMAERAGSVRDLVESLESSVGRVRESHAPDEAKIAFYEGVHALVERRAGEPVSRDRGSATSLTSARSGAAAGESLGPRRGMQ